MILSHTPKSRASEKGNEGPVRLSLYIILLYGDAIPISPNPLLFILSGSCLMITEPIKLHPPPSPSPLTRKSRRIPRWPLRWMATRFSSSTRAPGAQSLSLMLSLLEVRSTTMAWLWTSGGQHQCIRSEYTQCSDGHSIHYRSYIHMFKICSTIQGSRYVHNHHYHYAYASRASTCSCWRGRLNMRMGMSPGTPLLLLYVLLFLA